MAKRQAKATLSQTIDMLKGEDLSKLPPGDHRERKHLVFVVSPDGKYRRWRYRFTWKGKPEKIDIGSFPDVSRKMAVAECIRYTEWLESKPAKNPKDMLEREANEAADKSATVEHYLEKLKAKRRGTAPRTKAQYGRQWEKIRKVIGRRPAIEVTRPELLKKFDIERLHYDTPEECKQLCVQLYGLFEMVKKDFNLPNNIASYLTFNFQPVGHIRDVKHAPPMDYRDYPAFIKACHDYRARGGEEKGTRPDVSFLTEMLFLTGVRPQEPREATWGEIDWDEKTWNVPAAHRKTGMLKGIRPIPITPLVEKILIEMKERYPRAEKTDVIFPASRERKGGKKFFSDDAIRRHIHNSMRWRKPLNPHSARNGFISWWGHSDFADRRHLAEIQQDHALPGERVDAKLIAAYQRDTYLEPRRKMMTAFDAHCNPDKPSSAIVTHISKQRISA